MLRHHSTSFITKSSVNILRENYEFEKFSQLVRFCDECRKLLFMKFTLSHAFFFDGLCVVMIRKAPLLVTLI